MASDHQNDIKRTQDQSHDDETADPPSETLVRSLSSSTGARPKGILKNAGQSSEDRSPHLTWDEANIIAAEAERGGKMAITEPKTPYVRYNAETDEVEDLDKIPGFSLGQAENVSSPQNSTERSPSLSDGQPLASPTLSTGSSRRISDSNAGSRRSSDAGAGGLSRRGSQNSERIVEFVAPGGEDLNDSALEDEDDKPMDEETRAKQKNFAALRKGHYSNEAEAMKLAQQLMDDEDEDSPTATDETDRLDEEMTDGGAPNGAGAHRTRPGNGPIPPVPPLPNGFGH